MRKRGERELQSKIDKDEDSMLETQFHDGSMRQY